VPLPDKRLHHNIHELHIKVQIHSLPNTMPSMIECSDVQCRIQVQLTTYKRIVGNSHSANHNGCVKANIICTNGESVRKLGILSSPLNNFNFMLVIQIF
jgi:hypothetical protein